MCVLHVFKKKRPKKYNNNDGFPMKYTRALITFRVNTNSNIF